MAGLLRMAESFLEDVDRKAAPPAPAPLVSAVPLPSSSSSSSSGGGVGGGPGATTTEGAAARAGGPSSSSSSSSAALERQIAQLHAQLAEQRLTIADLRSALSRCDASAVEAAREEARAAGEEAAAAREVADAAERAVESARTDLILVQSNARRREGELAGEVDSLTRRVRELLDSSSSSGAADSLLYSGVGAGAGTGAGASSPDGKGIGRGSGGEGSSGGGMMQPPPPTPDHRAALARMRALESALSEERAAGRAATAASANAQSRLAEAEAAAALRDVQVKELQGEMARMQRQLQQAQALASSEALRAHKERVASLARRLSAAEDDKERLAQEARASRLMAGELRAQLADARSNIEDFEAAASRGSIPGAGAVATRLPIGRRDGTSGVSKVNSSLSLLGLLDSLFVAAGRLFSKSVRARVILVVYLLAVHAWCAYLLLAHPHIAVSHLSHGSASAGGPIGADGLGAIPGLAAVGSAMGGGVRREKGR